VPASRRRERADAQRRP